jgi:hypothetical protein
VSSPLRADNLPIKDERRVINLPSSVARTQGSKYTRSSDFTVVYLANMRDLIIKGMGRCVIIIEQRKLPDNIGGMLITSHNMELDYFKLHIVVNGSLCNKTTLNDRALQKITVVHEFTHTVAALSAIARVRSKELIKRLKDIFRKKAPLSMTDLAHLANDWSV